MAITMADLDRMEGLARAIIDENEEGSEDFLDARDSLLLVLREKVKRKTSASLLPTQDVPEIDPSDVGTFAGAFGEAGAEIITPAVTEPAAGFAGAIGGLLPGEEGQATDIVESTQRRAEEAFSAESRTGQDIVQKFTELPPIAALGRVVNDLNQRADISGDFVLEETGSPALAGGIKTAIKFVPDALGVATGVKIKRAATDPDAKQIPVQAKFNSSLEKLVKSLSKDPEIKVFKESGQVTEEALAAIEGVAPLVTPDDAPAIKPDDQADAPVVDDTELGALLTPEAMQVLQGAADNGVDVNDLAVNAAKAEGVELTPDMIARFDLFAKRGVPATKADITQSTDDFKFRNEAIKSTGIVDDVVTNQNQRLAELARQGQENVGPTATDLAQVNDSIFDSVFNIAETADNAVSEAYQLARETAPNDPIVRPINFFAELRRNVKSKVRQDNVPVEMLSVLKDLDQLSPDGKNVTGKLSVTDAEVEIRQQLNKIFGNTNNPAVKELVRDLKSALDEDVTNAVGGDVFKKARDSKIAFFDAIGRDPSSKFEKRTRSPIEDILNGTIKGDEIVKTMQTKLTADEFGSLKDFLVNKSGDQGVNAWNNFKAQIFEDALSKARGIKIGSKAGETINSFKGDQFKKVFDNLKNKGSAKGAQGKNRLEEIFNPDEIALIDDIVAISDLAKTNARVGTGFGASAQAITRASERAADLVDLFLSRSSFGLTEKLGANSKGLLKKLDDHKQQKLEQEFVEPGKFIEDQVRIAREAQQ